MDLRFGQWAEPLPFASLRPVPPRAFRGGSKRSLTYSGLVMGKVARWTFASGVVGTALALGGVYTWTLLVALPLFGASAVFAWMRESAPRLRPPARALVAVAVGLTAYTALQAVPLPAALVRILSPATGEVWRSSMQALQAPGPRWMTLSRDPFGTRIELVRGLLYLLALLAALRIARERDGQMFLERLLVAGPVLLGIAAVLHPAFGAERVFGLYKPVYDVGSRHLAPLLNANHLSGYLNVGICCAAAAALSPRPHTSRTVSLGVTVLLVGIDAWVGSRGGLGSLVFGLLAVALLSWRSAHADERFPLVPVLGGAVVVTATAMLVLASSDSAWSELSVRDISKLQMFGQAARLVASAPLFGVGRGAFATSFPLVRSGSYNLTYTHPENLIAQWTSEWGVPVSVLAFAVLAWNLRPSVMLARSRPPIGAWAALACLALHNLVDFSSEVPAVMLALVTCAALVTGGMAGSTSKRDGAPAPRLPSRLLRLGVASCVTLGLLVGATAFAHGSEEDGAALRALLLQRPADRAGFRQAVAAAIHRHPAEPYFPFLGAVRAMTVHDEAPLPWLEATLDRAPLVYGRAHLLLARSFFRRSPAQARLEYRLGYLQDPDEAAETSVEAAALVQGYDDARELAPGTSPYELQVASHLANTLSDRLPATAARLQADVASATGPDPAALEGELRTSIADLDDPSASWCEADAAGCFLRAQSYLAQLRLLAPDSCWVGVYEAELADRARDEARARTLVGQAARTPRDLSACLPAIVAAAERYSDGKQSEALADEIAHVACEGGESCDAALQALASTLR